MSSSPSPIQSQRQQYDNQMIKSVSYSSDNDEENNNDPIGRFDEQKSALATEEMNGMCKRKFSPFSLSRYQRRLR